MEKINLHGGYKMEKATRKPDFKSIDGFSVWSKKDKNGKPYLSLMFLGKTHNLFSTEKK